MLTVLERRREPSGVEVLGSGGRSLRSPRSAGEAAEAVAPVAVSILRPPFAVEEAAVPLVFSFSSAVEPAATTAFPSIAVAKRTP